MRKKNVAGFFALFFGMLGLHRFYLGQRKRGILYFVSTMVLFIASVENDVPLVLIMGAIAFIDSMLFLSMPAEEFNAKFNRHLSGHEYREESYPHRKMNFRQRRAAKKQAPADSFKASGISKYKDYDYEGAIEAFKKSLEENYNDPATHFNLACCYSLTERPDPAFFHLTKAVHFGFIDFDKIEKHDALAYLRTLPAFSEFVQNGYQRIVAVPGSQADLLSFLPQRKEGETLLEQIKRLGELRNKGILTEEEYVTQTKRVLGN